MNMTSQRMQTPMADMHRSLDITQDDAFQRRSNNGWGQARCCLWALQWHAHHIRGVAAYPSHSATTQSTRAVVKHHWRLHMAKVVHRLEYISAMKMRSMLSALLWCSLGGAGTTFAQTIDQPNLSDLGYSFTYGVTTAQPEGFDWTSAFSIQNVNIELIPRDSTVYGKTFAPADFAQVSPAAGGGSNLAYYDFNTEGMDFWGGVDASGVQVVHPEPLTFIPFPFEVGSVHQDSLSFEFSAFGMAISRDMVISQDGLASGTMLLPNGLSFDNTLQVSTWQSVMDSSASSVGGILIDGVTYWAPDMPLPIAQTYTYTQVVDGDSSVVFSGGEFLVNVATSVRPDPVVGLNAFPSPVTSTLTVQGRAGSIVTVVDSRGRTITTRRLLDDQETWDVSSWPEGVVFLTSDDMSSARRILVIH